MSARLPIIQLLELLLTPPDDPRLDQLVADLATLIESQAHMSTQLSELTAQVSATDTVMQSALTFIQGFSARLDAAVAKIATYDGAEAAALAADLKASSDALAAGVVANTPAAADPVVDPAPVPDAPVEVPVDTAPVEIPVVSPTEPVVVDPAAPAATPATDAPAS